MPKARTEDDANGEMTVGDVNSEQGDLQKEVQRFEAAVKDCYAAYFDAITRQVEELTDRLAQLSNRHEAIRRKLSLGEIVPPDTDAPTGKRDGGAMAWRDLWRGVCQYRQCFQEDILAPIRAHLETNDLGRALVDVRSSLAESLGDAVDALPEQVTRAYPTGLYASEPGDSWLLRGWKVGARLKRRARMLIASNTAHSEQVIPLRQLARHHVQARLVRQHASVLDAVEERITSWMAEMEQAATAATHTLLDYERRLDHLDFHHARSVEEAALRPHPAPTETTEIETLETPPAPPSMEDITTIRTVVKRVDAALSAGASLSVSDLRNAAMEQVAEAIEAMRTSATQPRFVRSSDDPPTVQLPPWDEWSEQVRTRIALCETMLGFYAKIEVVRDELIGEITENGPERVMRRLDRAVHQVEEQKAHVQGRLKGAGATDEMSAETFDQPLLAAAAAVEDEVEALRHAGIETEVREVVESGIDRIRALIQQLPTEVSVHAVPDDGSSPDGSARQHEVAVRTGAEVTWNVLFFDHLRTATQRLSEELADQIEATADIPAILHYSRDAACKELAVIQPASGNESEGQSGAEEETDQSALRRAKELSVGGLTRSARALAEHHHQIDVAAARWADTVWTTFRQGMGQLHDRWSTESRIRDRLAQISQRVSREARDVAADAQRHVQHGRVLAVRWFQAARHRAQALFRRGQAAIGLEPAPSDGVHETIETLASVNRELEELPVVYRRLFSFQPVDDPDLFVGREEDRSFIAQHVQRWQRGIPKPLVLVGDRGTGVTSLLKVVRTTTLRDAQLHHLQLDRRPSDERVLAAKVARALQLPESSIQQNLTLEDVGQALRDASPSQKVYACFVEHLEQLLLQTVGGADLLGQMLAFMARTDAHVLWIGTISTAAWQLVEQKIPATVRLVTSRRLSALSREALEELIMRRHRRSGLDLYFEPEVVSGPLRTRRLRRAETDDEQQARRTAYFDRLYEESHQNVMLALFYWFRSVRLRDDGRGLRVGPVRPVSFSVLEQLSLEQAFALKAFLVHATLTVDEYSQVAQIPRAESRDVMESLGNASLIEPVETSLTQPPRVHFETIYEDIRYRIRPLLIAPIMQHLKSRNVVH